MVSVYKSLVRRSTIVTTLSVLSLAALTACGSSSQKLAGTTDISEETTQEELIPPTTETLAIEASIAKMDFQEPALAQSEIVALEQIYSYVDPTRTISSNLKSQALAYYHANLSRISNKRYLTVVDFSLNSSQDRMFIIDMKSGAVTALHMAHGKRSDLNNDGYAETFSNRLLSQASSLGVYRTAETYNGKHGLSLRLDGLSATNSNARRRAVVIHGAPYVHEINVKAGRSWGCLAVPQGEAHSVVEMLKGGSIVYAGR